MASDISSAGHLGANLTPGTLVLTPVADGEPSVMGSLLSYDVGAAGLAVHVRAGVSAAAVEALNARRVWVSAHTDTGLIAFQGMAQRNNATTLDLSGVTAPVQEHRRTLLRAATQLSAELRLEDEPRKDSPIVGSTVDLSRGGCRVQLTRVELPDVGARVHLTIDLVGEPAVMDTHVLRVDPDVGQAVLRFTSLDAADAARIDRHVLSLVT